MLLISPVRTSFSSSFPSPGYLALNTPLSNPGRTATDTPSSVITCGCVTICTFGTNSKCPLSSSKAHSLSWLGVPLITITFPAAFES